MEKIPQNLIDRMMVKCARRCCVCRRFIPTKLQVHHIIERSKGGTNDEDNLIVTCFTCHTDIHSAIPFARRFSTDELKMHRNSLTKLVESGVFPEELDNTKEVDKRIVFDISNGQTYEDELSATAVEILLGAAHSTENRQGMIVVTHTNAGYKIFPGENGCPYPNKDRRSEARYRAALAELEEKGLVEYRTESVREVTHLGYLRADEIVSECGRQTE